MARDASRVAQKWANRLAGATEDIRLGVQGVTESPTRKAASKKSKFRARLLEAIDSGKWEAALNAVSLDEWKRLMEAGIGRIAEGAATKQEKMQKFMEKLLAYQESLKRKVDALPDETFEQRLQKMIAWVRGMKEFKR